MLTNFLGILLITFSLSGVLARTRFNGVNIAGFDFGCDTDVRVSPGHKVINADESAQGYCHHEGLTPPLRSTNGRKMGISRFKFNSDGPGQMKHFVRKHGLNVFRLPVAWQFLVKYKVGGRLNKKNSGLYDDLVQACLKTGAHCIIDVHNYGRYDGKVIGQGGPTDEKFANLWSQLATRYKHQGNVVMGLMNEPYDLDMNKWAVTMQKAVNAIRKAGATSHLILLPGKTNLTQLYPLHECAHLYEQNSAPFLSRVRDHDGSFSKLIYDVHKYYDNGDGHCRTDLINDVYKPLVKYLRTHHRQAFISETGGGSTQANCLQNACRGLKYIHRNGDVFLDISGWSAGAFSSSSYSLTLTPHGSAKHGWKDQKFLTQCFVPTWKTPTHRRPHKRVAELDDVIKIGDEVLVPREPISNLGSEVANVDEAQEMADA
ncbi:hypothetical protein MMC07_002752 [Pseudocyphellaria aurata]|nr:hypothetical protein [Pseudocyphellaria aurata]